MKCEVILFMAVALLTACQNNRMVVPYESDSQDVFTALTPNEPEQPEGYTYGPDSIPGLSFNYEMTTDNPEIYVNIQTFTILDINPGVTRSLFSFIKSELDEYGFIKLTKTISAPDSIILNKDSVFTDNYILDEFKSIKDEFDKELPVIQQYGSAFNILFDIYPVYIDDKYVTYRQSSYCYTGGAHGNTTASLITYDIESGKALNLYDIVKTDRINEVREEVIAHMAYSYPIYDNIKTVDEYIDSLNVWLGTSSDEEAASENPRITLENYPLPNPAINETGLVFIYETYQLTPGSDGTPIVVIPYIELKGCLKI